MGAAAAEGKRSTGEWGVFAETQKATLSHRAWLNRDSEFT